MNKPITTQQNPYLIPIAIIIAGVLIAGAVLFKQDSPTQTPTLPPEQQGPPFGQEAPPPSNIQIEFEGWPTIGSPEAKVVMVEYSDFACPFCKRNYDETFPLIKKQYIDTGQVRFVYKDFIIVGGDRAAEAAHCAAEQKAFWPYHDLLFEKQTEDRGRWSDVSVHRAYAKKLGLNPDALAKCFEERRYQEKVLASTQEAQTNGGEGTPFTLVNNIPVSGAQPFSAFQTVIDEELKKIR
jgi:protein-disulfide isomerase